MPGPSSLVLADGSIPKLPVSMDAASERMSPKMLPVTMVSKDFGFRMICIAALSTYLHGHHLRQPSLLGTIVSNVTKEMSGMFAHVHVTQLHIRVLFSHTRDNLLPQHGNLQDI